MKVLEKVVEKFVRRVVAAHPNETLHEVAVLMQQHNVGDVVVVEARRPVGIVTDRDVALELGAHGRSPATPVVRVMSTPAAVVHDRDGVFDITRAMLQHKVRRLPVVDDDGLLVGLVTLDDLLQLLGREMANLAESIRPEMAVR
jgi:CBS domain-containing protein